MIRLSRLGVFSALALAVVAGSGGKGQATELPRITPFSFAGWVVEGGDTGIVRLRCIASGNLPDSTRIEAHVTIVGSVGSIAGDTARVWRMGTLSDTWDIVCQVPPGQNFEVRGHARADMEPGVLDEVEWFMSGRKSVGQGRVSSHRVRERRRIGVQWYRLGGAFLVPQDSAESVTESDIVTRAAVTVSTPVRDSLAVLANEGRTTLQCVVCVDGNGAVREVWDASGARLNSVLRARIIQALSSGWTFTPAQTSSGAASDCVRCDVNLAMP